MNDFSRLEKQIKFILEIDKLKQIFRQTYLLDQTRRENDAEHSWHLSILALFLNENSNVPINTLRVVEMTLIHDIVEIDAGDTFAYDTEHAKTQMEREQKAAARIFSILPNDQKDYLRSLWDEFEAGKTPESKFARAIDRVQPLLHNCYTEGRAWKANGVKLSQVLDRNKHIEDGSKELWKFMKSLILEAAEKGYLENDLKGTL
jgi:putative hydrolase of HD superfamily